MKTEMSIHEAASKEWENKYNTELRERLMAKLSEEDLAWMKSRRLSKDEEVMQDVKVSLDIEEEKERAKEKECATKVQVQDVEAVIKPLEGISPSMIKHNGVLALVFAYMYNGITHSHPWSIKSTPKEATTFEVAKKKMIEWIEAINFRDSDIEIHIVVPGAKSSEGITKHNNERINNHLPSDGWQNRYDILIDNLSELELPTADKTFYAKRDSWKTSLLEYGMKNEKNRASLVNAIIKFRVQVQEDLDSEEHHDERMKTLELWIKSVPKSIQELSQKLHYF